MANPWTAMYWSDYDNKTAHLTMAEDGAYRRLLSHYYKTGKPLSANAEILLRVCRAFADEEKAAMRSVLSEFFTLEADGYHNKRADEELSRSAQISEKRRDAGKKGAEKTNSQKSANAEILPTHLPTQPQPQSHIKETPPYPLKEGESKKRNRGTPFADGYQPSQDHKNLAAELGVNLREEFPKFRDHFRGNGKRMLDWDATLRNWIRNAKAFQRANSARGLTVPVVSPKNPAEEMRRQLEAE